jgi:CheY-like chemotaxis protein
MGYNVITATGADEAINLLASHEVDILFSDIIMPNGMNGMNGIELAAYTGKHYPNVKIMLASGYALPALKIDHVSLNDFSFVSKPYRLADLARALRSSR